MSHFQYAKKKITYKGRGKIGFLFMKWCSLVNGELKFHSSRKEALEAVLGKHLRIV